MVTAFPIVNWEGAEQNNGVFPQLVLLQYYTVTFVNSSFTANTNMCIITFEEGRPNVFDVGPTLYKYYTNVLSLLG